MAGYLNKYHVGIDSKGYIIAQRGGRKQYDKKRAPNFVNKFGGGDAAYRDATFWQYFVQTNWRNGAKQFKWDDPGKFWKSQNVDTTQLEELTLSKVLTSVGQLAAGTKVNALEAWRSSTSWWNNNYLYRQQLTITAPSDKQVPSGYPIKVTIDTGALQTAGKVRSDRKDWRIVYFNGSSWVDLTRDYVSASVTFFPLQTAIASSGSDTNYYAFYGYSSESTDKQPSTEAGWNEVYGFYGSTPDANSKAIYHFREGSGTSINDDSSSSNTGSWNGTAPSWATDGLFGRYAPLNGTNNYVNCGNNSSLDLADLTLEGWFYLADVTTQSPLIAKPGSGGSLWEYSLFVKSGKLQAAISGSTLNVVGTTTLSVNTWYHLAVTLSGTSAKLYVNGTLETTTTVSTTFASTRDLLLGADGSGSVAVSCRMHHLRLSSVARTSFPYALATQPTVTAGSETTSQPTASSFDLYGGVSDGKVYKWDGTTSWTEQFDCRRLTWYDTGDDYNAVVGNSGGTEYKYAQSFQVTTTTNIRGVSLYLTRGTAVQGLTCRIETDSTSLPSGTLVNASATVDVANSGIPVSTGWVEFSFPASFALSASTSYWIVLQSASFGSETGSANWRGDSSSPTYSNGNAASKTGAGAWVADTAKDTLFRVLGESTEINCMIVTTVGGTQKLYVGTGDPTGTVNGNARLYGFDGSTWALTYTFATATESVINSIVEYTANSKVYLGVGPQAKVYETSNFTTFTLSKRITVPQNPGYVYSLKEFGSVLHAGGGSPEQIPTKFYNGFLNTYDTTTWRSLYPFDFTVIRSQEFYDAYLFIGTYRGDLYVYDTSSLNPLFNFRDQYAFSVEIKNMKYFDDKLYIGLYPQLSSNETNVGIWLFDRRGMSLAHYLSGVTGYRCFSVANGILFIGTGDNGYVYKLDTSSYATQGYYQSSYFDANLPSIDKLYNAVTVKNDALLSGQSVTVFYRFKESDSWTSLGVSNTVGGTEKTLSFPTATFSKKISLKVQLDTTDTAASPKLTESILQYSLYPTRKWQWTMRLLAKSSLMLLDKTTDTQTAATIRSQLEGLFSSQSLYTFVDIDSVSYTVLVTEIDQSSWVVNQDTVNEDEIAITLLEA